MKDTDTITVLGTNRGFLFGDAVFETMKVVQGQILFFEDHYFRLMSAMRIIRMEIPNDFTMEFLEDAIKAEIEKTNIKAPAFRVRMTVYRDSEGLYTPIHNEVGYIIQCSPLASAYYDFNNELYEVELFKDYYVSAQLLSTIKSTNRIINVVASIFAKENKYNNCILLNDSKNVVEAINGNLFIVIGNELITPPLSEGCLKGVLRKQILEIALKIDGLQVTEAIISPFDLQKANEVFITNCITGIQPVTQYRKKQYQTTKANKLTDLINDQIKTTLKQ